METILKIYETPYRASCGILRELDPNTGSFRTIAETGVLGCFARVKQLNGFKSRQVNKPVYDEVVICKIKVSSSSNKDVISHKVTGAKGEELKTRFATAWAEFEALEKAARAKQEKEAAAEKAAAQKAAETKTAENKTAKGK